MPKQVWEYLPAASCTACSWTPANAAGPASVARLASVTVAGAQDLQHLSLQVARPGAVLAMSGQTAPARPRDVAANRLRQLHAPRGRAVAEACARQATVIKALAQSIGDCGLCGLNASASAISLQLRLNSRTAAAPPPGAMPPLQHCSKLSN